MKRCGMSTRVGAIILAASMVIGDAVPTLAAQPASVDETVVLSTEAAETEATEASETTETEEGTEATEETEATEATENEEATEETEATEATETTETEEVEVEDDVLLGSEVGVSKVIGLEGEETWDGTLNGRGDSQVKKAYVYVNRSEETTVTVPGKAADYLDAETGLYKYNDTYYDDCYPYTDKVKLEGKVASVVKDAPKSDEATSLYVVDGKYYWGCNSTGKCYYFTVENEVDVLGNVTDAENPLAAYTKKVAETENSDVYYEANGKDYRYAYSNSKVVLAYKSSEISFDKRHHEITWNNVTNETEISANGKLYHIGYQVKVNGTDAKLGYETTDGQTFTTDTSFETAQVFAPGEQNIYEVRAVYYTETKKKISDAAGNVTGTRYEYAIAKTGDWSAAYGYSFAATKPELQKISKVTGVNATWKDHETVELSWNGVKEASYYTYQVIFSDTPLTLTEESWDCADDEWVPNKRTYDTLDVYSTYTYYRVRAHVSYENEIYDGSYGEYSDVVTLQKSSEAATLPTISGLKVENNTDGTFNLKWNKVDTDGEVRIYYTTDASVFTSDAFKYILANPKAVTVEQRTSSWCQEEECDYWDQDDCPYPEHYVYKVTSTEYLVEQDEVAEQVTIADKKVNYASVSSSTTEVSSDDFYGLETGKKYYFVAVIVNDNKSDENRVDITPYVLNSVKYGYYNDITISSQVSATENMGKISKPDTKSEKTSITMTFDKGNNITGFEIYRKNTKGKYVKVTTTTSAQYVDKNLKENTTYSYKARAYNYNPVTKKTIYSDYVVFSAETSTNNYIDVKVTKASKTSAKVTWTKVAGATKYEIYRTSTSSTDSNYSKKTGTASNKKWKLVKTITKAKTTSYTDKKLNAGETYSYKVVAYYKAGKETKQINDSDFVVLDIETPQNVVALLSGSTVKVTWDADKYATKYEVRYTKYNAQGKAYTDAPVVASTKKASYSIKGLKAGEYVVVSVRATNGKKWSGWSYNWNDEDIATMYLPAVKSVSAKNVTVKDANGVESTKVKVSWKAVSGAAYYKVYRSTSPVGKYNKDLKVYDAPSDRVSIVKESNTDEKNSVVRYDDYKGQSGTIVGTSAIDGGQTQTGVTYYYYVEAYAENGTAVSAGYAKAAKVTFNATASIKSAKATKGKVTVSINKVAGAKQYVVYRSTKSNKGFEKIGTTKKTTYVDKKAKKGKTYYYKVVAVGTNALRADFETDMSSAVKVKAK